MSYKDDVAKLNSLFNTTFEKRQVFWQEQMEQAQSKSQQIEIRQKEALEMQKLRDQFEARKKLLRQAHKIEDAKIETVIAQGEKEEVEENVKRLSYDLVKSESKMAHDEAVIESLQSGVGELAETVSDLKQQIHVKESQIKKVEVQKSQLEKLAKKSLITTEELQKSLQEMHVLKLNHTKEIQMLAKELEDSVQQIKLCKINVNEIEQELTKEQQHHEILLEKLEYWTSNNQKLQNEVSDYKEQIDIYKQELSQERIKLAEAHNVAKLTQDQQSQYLQEQLREAKISQDQLIHECRMNLSLVQEENTKRQERIQDLEEEIQSQEETSKQIKAEHLLTLKEEVNQLMKENKELRNLIHSNQVQSTIPLVEVIKDTHRKLAENVQEKTRTLKMQDEVLLDNNEKLQSCASEVKLLQSHTKALEAKIESCLFPGEKRVLLEQLEATIAKKNEMGEFMNQLLQQNRILAMETKSAKLEIGKLRNLVEKYTLDLNSMSSLTAESAKLSSDLVNAQRSMKDKDKQLHLIAKQLEVILSRSKHLEKQNNDLEQRLRFTSSPKELENLNNRLIVCQREGEKTNNDAEKLRQIVIRLEEQNILNNEKIRSLIDVLKRTEDTKQQLLQEQTIKMEFEQALLECGEQKTNITNELNARLEVLDQQYQSNLIQHAKILNAANQKIQYLEAALVNQEEAFLKKQPKFSKSYPQIESSNDNINEVISRMQQDVIRAKSVEPIEGIKTLNGKSMQDMNAMTNKYFQLKQEKEAQMMRGREQTLDEMQQAIKQSNPNNSSQLASTIQQIQARGLAREQEYSKDMLELQAIHDQLAHESSNMKRAQWELMQEANNHSKQNVKAMVSESKPNLLANIAYGRDVLAESQHSYIDTSKQELQQELDAQNRYATHLKTNIIPKMDETRNMIETLNIPSLVEVQKRLKEQSALASDSLDREDTEAEDQRRSQSLLEDRLKAMQAENNRISQSISTWIANPGPKARTDVIEAANSDQDVLMNRARNARNLRDDKPIRVNLVVNPRTPEQIAANVPMATSDQMRVDTNRNSIIMSVNGQDYKYFGDNVSVLETPQAVINNTMPRFGRAVQERKDLIFISYGYESVENAKRLLFQNAIRKLSDEIKRFRGTNESVEIKLVQLLKGNARIDLLNEKKPLLQNCDSKTCNSKVLSTKEDIYTVIEKKIPDSKLEDTNDSFIVLSFLFPNHSIHIVDMLFEKVEDIRLMDRNWIDYLGPVLKENNYYIDLIYSTFPTGTAIDLERSNKMLQLNSRMAKFLAEFQTISSS